MTFDADFFESVGGRPLILGNGQIAWNFGWNPRNTMDILRYFGGVPLIQGDGDIAWNFGLAGAYPAMLPPEVPTLYQAAPHLQGRWDGRSSISLWEVTRKVLGQFLPSQKQTRGTCVSRGASAALNIRQCCLIAAGRLLEYKPVSHAWIYGGARQRANMLGPQDGAIGLEAAYWLAERGTLTQNEANDNDYGSDDLAVAWGSRGVPANLMPTASDNLLTGVAKCTSAQMAADAIAGLRPVTVASSRGFAMTRDAYGVCRPDGVWMHQMHFASLHVLPDGRKVFGCGQSWGRNVPDGPTLPGCPDHVFGVDWDTADAMLRQQDSAVYSDFEGWQAADIPWIFI